MVRRILWLLENETFSSANRNMRDAIQIKVAQRFAELGFDLDEIEFMIGDLTAQGWTVEQIQSLEKPGNGGGNNGNGNGNNVPRKP